MLDRKSDGVAVAGPDGCLACLRPFETEEMSGRWDDDTYVVRSGDTPIARVSRRTGLVYLNLARLGRRAARHQRIAARWTGFAVAWVREPADGRAGVAAAARFGAARVRSS